MYSFALAAYLESEGYIFRNVHVGKQRIFLKDRIDMPLVGRKVGYVLALEQHLSGIRLLESCPVSLRW